MTKDSITKHWKLLLWIHSREKAPILRKNPNSNKWEEVTDFTFKEDEMYIQNDEYVHLRKAIVEGKQIQSTRHTHKSGNPMSYAHWTPVSKHPTDEFVLAPKNYRIKPAPKYALGKFYHFQTTSQKIIIYLEDIAENGDILACQTFYKNNGCSCKPHTENILGEWKPKQDEICIFYNIEEQNYTVDRYDTPCKDKHYAEQAAQIFDSVAPYCAHWFIHNKFFKKD